MRISGPHRSGVAAAAPAARRAKAGAFAVTAEEPASAAPSLAALPAVGGIEALIALQGVMDAAERRRRAVGHGRVALAALDDLKLGVLAGSLDGAALGRLKAAAAALKDGSGDERLDGVLGEIELRVEVELAKLEPRPAV